ATGPRRRRGREDTGYFFFRRLAERRPFFAGTLPPARRACERPIAIACFRLLTLLPERPDLSVPRFRSCMAFWTFWEAFLPYRAMIGRQRRGAIPAIPPRRVERAGRDGSGRGRHATGAAGPAPARPRAGARTSTA